MDKAATLLVVFGGRPGLTPLILFSDVQSSTRVSGRVMTTKDRRVQAL